VLGLTGAQWMCVALVPVAAWVLLRVRPQLAAGQEAAAELPTRPVSS
jgi:hypothetical protein